VAAKTLRLDELTVTPAELERKKLMNSDVDDNKTFSRVCFTFVAGCPRVDWRIR
jgi:hypothetical protein